MRRKIFSIWSVLLVLVALIAVLVPGCNGGGGEEGTEEGTIVVQATFDGDPWEGAVDYTLTPESGSPITGTAVPTTHSNMAVGDWTCSYDSGGPPGADLIPLDPTMKELSAGGTITFIFEFVTPQGAALDHFKCYWIENEVFLGDYVYLEDQFLALEAEVDWAYYFCNPVEKTYDGEVTEIKNRDYHLTIYDLYYEEEPQMWSVQVDNQFGTQQLTVWGPTGIAVPTQKLEPGGHEPPVGLDHFLLYDVIEGPDVDVVVGLDDQFGDQPEVFVYNPIIFANPVRKTDAAGMVTDIQNPDEHQVYYYISGDPVNYPQVQVVNQFGEQTFAVYDPLLLAVPSDKISFEQVEPEPVALDHFQCYKVPQTSDVTFVTTPPPWDIYVEDQFVADEAHVDELWYFCNPTEKTYNGVVTPILDANHHLTVYSLQCYDVVGQWSVQVNNQFGIQQMTVQGPVALAVPTQKLEPGNHDPPVGLNHFLLYEVIESHGGMWQVDLNDQFGYRPDVDVLAPLFFANPVQKTHGDMVWPIEDGEAHLVFYDTSVANLYTYPQAIGLDQFAQWYHVNLEGPWLLAVPSQKISWEQQPMQ